MLSDELLKLAEELPGLDSTRPRQAVLRRAVSTAYYALYHLLVEAAVKRMYPSDSDIALRQEAARRFGHRGIQEVMIAAGQTGERRKRELLETLGSENPSPELETVKEAYLTLLAARERADYDLTVRLRKLEVHRHLRFARQALSVWSTLRLTPEGQRLSLALILHARTR